MFKSLLLRRLKGCGKPYNALLQNVGQALEKSRQKVAVTVGSVMVQTYWEIGRQIVEYEQKGNEKAEDVPDISKSSDSV